MKKIYPNTPRERESLWQVANIAIREAAINNLTKSANPSKQWMTDEILQLMEKRRQVKGKDNEQYQRFCHEVKRRCSEAEKN